MAPIGLNTSRSISALEKGEAKLWILLVGLNRYQDKNLHSLRYAASDCQKLKEALLAATKLFPEKEIITHHDFSEQSPCLQVVHKSFQHITESAKEGDTVLFYFSGHGFLEPKSQQTVLCLCDTDKNDLLNTGFQLQELLNILSNCKATKQLVWLDCCHSGNIRLSGSKGETPENDPTPKIMELLRQRTAKSKGFYAMLSCDMGQYSWEFPDLGHGVFTYYLMRGLRGEAANSSGIIDADNLYRYIYDRTLEYIEKANEQVRLVNRQKQVRGEVNLLPEYSQQTPKRIVEGVGELILGFEPDTQMIWQHRSALIVEGLDSDGETFEVLSKLLQKEGGFQLDYVNVAGKSESRVREGIQSFFKRLDHSHSQTFSPFLRESVTCLLYLRGKIEDTPEGESYLVLANGLRLSRTWWRQELRRCKATQQIIILDCPESDSLLDWLEELKLNADRAQCLLAGAPAAVDAELFAQVLLESLVAANPHLGMSVANWVPQLQNNLHNLDIPFEVWLSATQGVIEILPSKVAEKQQHHNLKILTNTLEYQQHPQSLGQRQKIHTEIAIPVPVPELSQQTLITTFKTKLKLTLSSEQYNRLLTFLLEMIGPIAPIVLNETLANTSNIKDFVNYLSLYLPPNQRVDFAQWINTLWSHTQILATPLKGSYSEDQPTISPQQYTELELFLKNLIGPIAPTLLRHNRADTSSLEAIITALKKYLNPTQHIALEQWVAVSLAGTTPQIKQKQSLIPDVAKAHEFRQSWSKRE